MEWATQKNNSLARDTPDTITCPIMSGTGCREASTNRRGQIQENGTTYARIHTTPLKFDPPNEGKILKKSTPNRVEIRTESVKREKEPLQGHLGGARGPISSESTHPSGTNLHPQI